MTDPTNPISALEIAKTLGQLGFEVILLYFVVELWQDKKKMREELNNLNKSNQEQLIKLIEKGHTVIEENTKSNIKLQATGDAQVKASDSLTDAIHDLLKERQK